MKTLNLVSMAVAWALAGTAYTAGADGTGTSPGTASSPHQRQTTSTQAPESAPAGRTEPGASSSQHQRDATSGTHVADAGTGKPDAKMMGMKVQMSSGESLGEVKEILADKKGDPSYVVISHGGVMGVGAKRTAVPWATVKSSMHEDRLIMDRSQLEQAPVLADNKTPDATTGTWSREADDYWRTKSSTRATSSPDKERT
jgi:sporulation protein YlmC with PRC-barrel domain